MEASTPGIGNYSSRQKSAVAKKTALNNVTCHAFRQLPTDSGVLEALSRNKAVFRATNFTIATGL